MKSFWFVLFMTILVWYFFVTAIVAIKGYTNIKDMLKLLRDAED